MGRRGSKAPTQRLTCKLILTMYPDLSVGPPTPTPLKPLQLAALTSTYLCTTQLCVCAGPAPTAGSGGCANDQERVGPLSTHTHIYTHIYTQTHLEQLFLQVQVQVVRHCSPLPQHPLAGRDDGGLGGWQVGVGLGLAQGGCGWPLDTHTHTHTTHM